MFAVFYALLPHLPFDGALAGLYFIGHSLIRLSLEFFRQDDRGKLWGKLTHTNLADGLDELLSSHESGYPKEHPNFWRYAFDKFNLDPARCLFIDDSEVILAASKLAGVGYQLGVSNPDSKKPYTVFKQFPAVSDLLDAL